MATNKRPMSTAQLRYFGPAAQRGYPTTDKTRAVSVTTTNPPPPKTKGGSKGKK